MCIFRLSIWKKGWKLFDFETREFVTSLDVIFVEDKFPFLSESRVALPHEN